MKDNDKVIHFYIKNRGVQGLVFVQIKFEKCTTIFYFENGGVSIKKNRQTVASVSLKHFGVFSHFHAALLSTKTCFCETSNTFYLKK